MTAAITALTTKELSHLRWALKKGLCSQAHAAKMLALSQKNVARLKYQRTMVESGRCRQCGKKRKHYAQHCDPCQVKQRERNGRHQCTNAWRPGGPGRPPLVR